MAYYHLLIGLTMLTVGLANRITNILSNEPTHCCFPDVYSSKTKSSSQISFPDGTISTSNALNEFTRDGRSELIGIRGFTQVASNNYENYFWNIYDLKKKTVYSIYSDANICYKFNYPDSNLENNYIPETAIYLNSSTYEYNREKILADTWFVQNSDTVMYQTYMRDKCIPLKTEHVSRNPSISGSSITIDYAESIVDPTILEIPSICPQ